MKAPKYRFPDYKVIDVEVPPLGEHFGVKLVGSEVKNMYLDGRRSTGILTFRISMKWLILR